MRGIYFLVSILLLASCSKCYDCVETRSIYDSNGNVINSYETSEQVCTADTKEIQDREANGAVCR